jgi:hypothetical protein
MILEEFIIVPNGSKWLVPSSKQFLANLARKYGTIYERSMGTDPELVPGCCSARLLLLGVLKKRWPQVSPESRSQDSAECEGADLSDLFVMQMRCWMWQQPNCISCRIPLGPLVPPVNKKGQGSLGEALKVARSQQAMSEAM